MRHLFQFVKEFKKECIIAPLFKGLEVCFELCVPLVMAWLIDDGIGKNNPSLVWGLVGVLVLLGALGLSATVVAQYFAAKASVGIVARIKRALLNHIQGLSYAELDKIGTSTMITRMTGDANQVQAGINLTLRLILRSPFVVVGAMIMAFTIDFDAALVFVLVIAALSVVVFGIMLLNIPLLKKVQQKLDGVLGTVRENLSGVRVIRAFGQQGTQTTRFDEKNEALIRAQTPVNRLSALLNPLTYVLINLAVLALIHVGAIKVDGGVLTQGAVIALYNYMGQILVELIKLANLIITITKAIACQKRIESVFEVTSSMTVSNNPLVMCDGSVSFDNVALRYGGAGDEALSGVSFSAKAGDTVGVIGGTGSGKSTLVSLIPRLYDTTSGTVKVGGADVRGLDPEKLRAAIGVVPQKAVLFAGTIRDNLKWGNENATEEELWDALAAAQADGFVREKGLDAPVEQNGRNFSGGQRQRLTIARALVKKPAILILDDSSSALDFATDAALRRAIKALDYNPTTFIVSQRTASLMHADTILVLDDGEVVGQGTHDELLTTCEVYREIYDSQFKKEGAR